MGFEKSKNWVLGGAGGFGSGGDSEFLAEAGFIPVLEVGAGVGGVTIRANVHEVSGVVDEIPVELLGPFGLGESVVKLGSLPGEADLAGAGHLGSVSPSSSQSCFANSAAERRRVRLNS